jgi:hypothetical protein
MPCGASRKIKKTRTGARLRLAVYSSHQAYQKEKKKQKTKKKQEGLLCEASIK